MKGVSFIRVTFDAFPRRPWEGGGNEGKNTILCILKFICELFERGLGFRIINGTKIVLFSIILKNKQVIYNE